MGDNERPRLLVHFTESLNARRAVVLGNEKTDIDNRCMLTAYLSDLGIFFNHHPGNLFDGYQAAPFYFTTVYIARLSIFSLHPSFSFLFPCDLAWRKQRHYSLTQDYSLNPKFYVCFFLQPLSSTSLTDLNFQSIYIQGDFYNRVFISVSNGLDLLDVDVPDAFHSCCIGIVCLECGFGGSPGLSHLAGRSGGLA